MILKLGFRQIYEFVLVTAYVLAPLGMFYTLVGRIGTLGGRIGTLGAPWGIPIGSVLVSCAGGAAFDS